MMNGKPGRWILSAIALFTAVFPFVADMNKTHMYNQRWEAHAKYHAAQTIVLGTLLGLSSLFFLWRRKGDQQLQLQVGTLLASLFWIGQVGSIFFPGTAFYDPENTSIPGNLRPFLNQGTLDAIILPLTATGYFLEQQRIKRESKLF